MPCSSWSLRRRRQTCTTRRTPKAARTSTSTPNRSRCACASARTFEGSKIGGIGACSDPQPQPQPLPFPLTPSLDSAGVDRLQRILEQPVVTQAGIAVLLSIGATTVVVAESPQGGAAARVSVAHHGGQHTQVVVTIGGRPEVQRDN